MKKLKMATQKLTFQEGCEKYLAYCRQRNLRKGTVDHYIICNVDSFSPPRELDIPSLEPISSDKATILEFRLSNYDNRMRNRVPNPSKTITYYEVIANQKR